ncbi:hypothetical protein V8E36_008894 [Tilletia maclaganii]
MDGPSKKTANPRKRSFWSEEEDQLLAQVVNESRSSDGKTVDWKAVTESMSNRSAEMCRKRWNLRQEYQGEEIKKGGWSPDEDQRLIEFMNSPNKPEKNVWAAAAKAIKTRKPDQCSKRWKDSLDPSLDHSSWTSDEDNKLIEAQRIYGTTWSDIKNNVFPRRPTLELKNRWDHLSRVLKREHNRQGKSKAAGASPTADDDTSSPATRSASLSSASSSTPSSHGPDSPVLAATVPTMSKDSAHSLLTSTSMTLPSMSREDKMALCSFLQSSISTEAAAPSTQTSVPLHPPSAHLDIPGLTSSPSLSGEGWSFFQQSPSFSFAAGPSGKGAGFQNLHHQQSSSDFTTFSPMLSGGDKHVSPLSSMPGLQTSFGDPSFWRAFESPAQPQRTTPQDSNTVSQPLSHASSVSSLGGARSMFDLSTSLDLAMLDFVFPPAPENATGLSGGDSNNQNVPENGSFSLGSAVQGQGIEAITFSNPFPASVASSQQGTALGSHPVPAAAAVPGLDNMTAALANGHMPMLPELMRTASDVDTDALATRRASSDTAIDSVLGSTTTGSSSSCPTTPAPETSPDTDGTEQVIHTQQGKDDRVIVIVCNRNSLQNVLKDLREGTTES